MLDRYTGVGIGEVPLGEAIAQLLEVLRRHRLRLPSDLSLLLKVLVMDQGMARWTRSVSGVHRVQGTGSPPASSPTRSASWA